MANKLAMPIPVVPVAPPAPVMAIVPPPSVDPIAITGATTTSVPPPPEVVRDVRFSTPSNWNIQSAGGDVIRARNNVTSDTFEGTMADFNKLLKG